MKIIRMAALSAMLLLAACASIVTEIEKHIEYDDIIKGLSVSAEEILYQKDKSTDFTVINIWSISWRMIILGTAPLLQ